MLKKTFGAIILMMIPVMLAEAQQKVKVKPIINRGFAEFELKNYWGALDIYRDAYELEEDNALINFRMGECHYALKHYTIAKSFLERAKELNPRVDLALSLSLAKTYHRLEELDKAITHYKEYKKITEDEWEEMEMRRYIKECEYAKELMAQPVNVKIKNLGTGINSRFDDYAPSVSSDGKFLVFTARRPTMSSGRIDVKNDYKHFEDIYFSLWNEQTNHWETAESLAENINTEGHDAVLSLTPDGKGIFIYKNNQKSAGDIFYTEKTGEFTWSDPIKLERPINTSYFESSVSITADGQTMYFISERPNGFGLGDIYVSNKVSDKKWGSPKNIGKVINTLGDEKFVFVHPKGNVLFFASNGHLTMGSYDIFRCVREGNKWGDPVNLGYPINTVNEESTFSMTADNKKLMISAEYEGGVGERDIYEIDLSEFDILEELQIQVENISTDSRTLVYGKLINRKTQESIPNQPITIVDNRSGEIVFETQSDEEGNYEVDLLKGNSFYIKVNAKGFEKYEKRLSLKNEMAELNEVYRDIELRLKN